ncbi:uncharacterized protein LOC113903692, partial [Bos indicus x Bos taurus]|uniref:uncharacterized protein LOC113903692 n=1 Tax=Bos indicus x Bos taurus TaxID=30522 RepID=UPI000F7D27A9
GSGGVPGAREAAETDLPTATEWNHRHTRHLARGCAAPEQRPRETPARPRPHGAPPQAAFPRPRGAAPGPAPRASRRTRRGRRAESLGRASSRVGGAQRACERPAPRPCLGAGLCGRRAGRAPARGACGRGAQAGVGGCESGSAARLTGSISESLPQKYVDHLSGAAGQRGKEDVKWTSRRTHERLAVISTKLEVEKQQNRSLFNTVSTRPVLEPPCVGNFNNPLVLNGNLTPRANVRFSTSIPHPSNNSMETYLTKMWQELDRSITRELREAAAEFESESYGLSPLGATDGSNLSEDLLLKTSQEYVQIWKKKKYDLKDK